MKLSKKATGLALATITSTAGLAGAAGLFDPASAHTTASPATYRFPMNDHFTINDRTAAARDDGWQQRDTDSVSTDADNATVAATDADGDHDGTPVARDADGDFDGTPVARDADGDFDGTMASMQAFRGDGNRCRPVQTHVWRQDTGWTCMTAPRNAGHRPAPGRDMHQGPVTVLHGVQRG